MAQICQILKEKNSNRQIVTMNSSKYPKICNVHLFQILEYIPTAMAAKPLVLILPHAYAPTPI